MFTFVILAGSLGACSDSYDDGNAEHLERQRKALATEKSGEAYIEQCRENGVPIPEQVLSSAWTNRGEIKNTFILKSKESELWSWEPDDPSRPDGVCLALPRWEDGYSGLFGIICLGRQSSKACFFDNESVPRGDPHPIDEWVGGEALDGNGGGMCSDCHAGRNPFVVHPEEAPYQDLQQDNVDLNPKRWHDPIVHVTWPDNPGPIPRLGPVSSNQARCDSCHSKSSQYASGRFPRLTYSTSSGPKKMDGYCNTVLENALTKPNRTMPPFGLPDSDYAEHKKWLRNLCDVPPGAGTPTSDVRDRPIEVVSPPKVVEPIWKCTDRAGVRGVLDGASVTLHVEDSNGTKKYTGTKTGPATGRLTFTVSPAFDAGDKVWATQTINGKPPAASPKVTVGEYLEEHPNGPPPPNIHTPIHECSKSIGIDGINGASVVVRRNGSQDFTMTLGPYLTWRNGLAPYNDTDSVSARQVICEEESAYSGSVTVKEAPSTLSEIKMTPAVNYANQKTIDLTGITEGSEVDIGLKGAGQIASLGSYPFFWRNNYEVHKPLGRPLQQGDELVFEPNLCEDGPTSTGTPVEPCDELPAPKILPPQAGDDFVVVVDSAPGATIRVFVGSTEVGNGPGPVIRLTAALQATDTVKVLQQVGECIGQTGRSYEVSQVEPD